MTTIPHDDSHERFWSRVQKTDSCWLWLGGRNNKGYGFLGVRGRNTLAHRFSYEIHHGPIPDGLLVCHTCDVPACVRPDHLWLGTVKQNADDMVRKGRGRNYRAEGVDNPRAKLTEQSVRDMRLLYSHGHSLTALATLFNVTRHMVWLIVTRRSWQHIS